MKHLFVTLIVPASVIIPIGAGLIKKVYRSVPNRIIFWYLVFAGLVDVAERIMGMHQINNLPLLHFYTILEFLFILRYFQLFWLNSTAALLIWIIMIVFPILSIADLVFIQDIHKYNSYPRPIAALTIIALCMYYFYNYAVSESKEAWSKLPVNWIVTGLLVYFCSSLFYFAFLNVIYETASRATYYFFGGVHATLVLLMYLLFTIGFLKLKNER